jgi:hypothetical protein
MSSTNLTRRGRADVERALHSLEGILLGITLDQALHKKGVEYLCAWMRAHEYLVDLEPLSSIASGLREVIDHGVLRSDFYRDLLWTIKTWSTSNPYYDDVTADMQRLHGIMAGVAADDALTDNEMKGIQRWADDHHDLAGHWPYDDLIHHLHDVLEDGILHPEKREIALKFLREFGGEPSELPVNHDSHKEKRLPWLRSQNPIMTTLSGICEKNPVIEFEQRNFCFTGKARSGPRAELETHVVLRGGVIVGVVRSLHYLVIGSNSNPCWAYATYGRKVESVMHLRESGSEILIINEDDFLKAIG